jgi:glycosyltransferase involved in cell wall biosynthesis
LPISIESDAADVVEAMRGVEIHRIDSKFAFGKWYSSHPLTKMISTQVATARGRAKAATLLRTRHRERPFDVLYQFSTVELFGLPADGELPPIVTHPSVHAAGELRWLKSERRLAERCQGRLRPLLVRLWVAARVQRQRRDIARAAKVLAISAPFAELLCADYGINPAMVTVAENVIDVESFDVPVGPRRPGPVRVVVLGRITVRKGLEDVVAATHLLTDLEGRLTIDVIGDHSLWSDYRPLLADLAPQIATYVGHRPRAVVQETLGQADVLVQASHYEPFGLTVAEALAAGVLVLATPAVGAASGLDASVVTLVEPGNSVALADALRRLVERVENEDDVERDVRRQRCRAAALERFTAATVAPVVDRVLREAAETKTREP